MTPGQNICDLLNLLAPAQLRAIIPQGTLDIIDALYPEAQRSESVRKFIAKIPPNELFDKGHLGTFLSLLSEGKQHELATRLGFTDGMPLEQLIVLAQRPESRTVVLEFFGYDSSIAKTPIATSEVDICSAEYSLFPHQLTLLYRLKQQLAHEPHSVVAHMPTGSGKTRTAMHFICEHLRNNAPSVVIWLANSRELLEQARNEFGKAWSFLGNRQIQSYAFFGNAKEQFNDLNDGVVFGSLQKLYALKTNNLQLFLTLASKTSLLIVDEAHISVAPTYQEVIQFLWKKEPGRKLIGLTATPGRTWADIEEDARLSDMYGKKKVTLEVAGYSDPVTYLIEEQYLAKPIFKLLNTAPGLKLSAKDKSWLSEKLEIPEALLERLGEDPQRNLQILDATKDLLSRHNRVIVFMPSVTSAKQIAAIMAIETNYKSAYITGDMDTRTRDAAIKDFRNAQPIPKVLFNFGVLSAGFDAPKTSAALIARPTLSLVLFSQMIGRATRGVKAGGNLTAEIVTVVDPELPGFGKIEEAFRNWEDVWDE